MTKPIALVTGNPNKARELAQLLEVPIEAVRLELAEIQSMDVTEVAIAKATAAFAVLARPLVVADTALHIDGLGGLPGPFVTWFLERLGPDGIAKMARGTGGVRATASTCLAFADSDGHVLSFLGELKGEISSEPRGQGFGFDPIFVPDGLQRTLGELRVSEKNDLSMRARAVRALKSHLLSSGRAPGAS